MDYNKFGNETKKFLLFYNEPNSENLTLLDMINTAPDLLADMIIERLEEDYKVVLEGSMYSDNITDIFLDISDNIEKLSDYDFGQLVYNYFTNFYKGLWENRLD